MRSCKWIPLLLAAVMGAEELDEHFISTQEVRVEAEMSLCGWEEDFEKASVKAREAGCPLLIAFLGPNWCEPSDLLERDVLARSVFRDGLMGEVILVKVDLPEGYSREESHPGVQLMHRFGVQQCPELVLLKCDGVEIGRVKNLDLKGAQFASHIKEMIGDYRLLNEEFAHVEELEPEKLEGLYANAGQFADRHLRKVLMKEGLKKDEGPYFLLEKYGKRLAKGKYANTKSKRLRSEIVAMDPKNLKGALRKLAVLDFEALAQASGKSPKKVIQPVTEYLKTYAHIDGEAWKLELMLSQYLFGKNEKNAALQHAKASLELAPENEKAEIIKSVEYLSPRGAVRNHAQ